MEVQGKIKLIGKTETFGKNDFRKRELVITTDEQYPQHILIEFVQDKTDLLNNYKVGQDVKVGVNLRGREWVNPEGVTKYFNSIQGWRIDKVDVNADGLENAKKVAETFETVSSDDLKEDHDDLPFN